MHFLENHKQMINNAKAYLTYGLWNLVMIKNMLNGFIALFYRITSIYEKHKTSNFLDRKYFIHVILSKSIFECLSIVLRHYLKNNV